MSVAQPTLSSARADGRAANQLRPLRFINGIAPHATGSTLIEWGNTRVICGVTVEENVPRWMKEQNVVGGWITGYLTRRGYSKSRARKTGMLLLACLVVPIWFVSRLLKSMKGRDEPPPPRAGSV